ncbi:hypothetical protein GCM10010331_70790 [Streptomyces xanthochromogenes]|nr:hypothetical protein GCM10010331_70790 [Streptomyces xanthochromogenes]
MGGLDQDGGCVIGLVDAEEEPAGLTGAGAEAVREQTHEGFVHLGGVTQVALDIAAVGVESDTGESGCGCHATDSSWVA